MPSDRQQPPAAYGEQVRKLLQSSILRSSETQRRLLQYLAEKSLDGTADSLKEYTVGVEALGKPETYDPRQDPSVRIQAGKLRLKIEEFYRTEGAAEPIRIEFPKGRFKLVFRAAPPQQSGAAASAAARRWRRAAVLLGAALALSVAAAVVSSVRLGRLEERVGAASAMWTPELEQIWSPFVSDARPVVLCIGAPLFVEFRGAGMFRATSLNDWAAMQASPVFAQMKQLFPNRTRPMHVFTGVGEAGGAFHLARLLGTRRNDLLLARSNVLSWEEIANSNAVFLGPPKYVPHLKDIPIEQELVVDSESDLIRNLRPAPGEPSTFPDQVRRDDTETHALISRLPGLHGRGEVFIFASNWTGGTLAAVQYATQPDYARDLVQRLRLPSGELPQHYQIVIKVYLQNLYPVKIAHVLHHVLGRPKDGTAGSTR